MNKPSMLFIDFETSALNGDAWQKHFRHGGSLLKVKRHREILCYAYSYLGDSKVGCITREGDKSDLGVTKSALNRYNKADVVVAHNLKGFDRKVLRTRAVLHQLGDVAPNSIIDTLEVAKSGFLFSGNSLDDLAQFFGIGRKLPLPGYSLWERCDEGDPKAWRIMERYNKHDIYLLKGVYERMRPYIENHPHWGRLLRPETQDVSCSKCGSRDMTSRGYKYKATNKTVQRQWNCRRCGGWDTYPLKMKGRK